MKNAVEECMADTAELLNTSNLEKETSSSLQHNG